MADILEWDGITKHDIPVERVMNWAKKAKLANVLIIGETEDGDFYFASSRASGADIIWDMELAKKKLLEMTDE